MWSAKPCLVWGWFAQSGVFRLSNPKLTLRQFALSRGRGLKQHKLFKKLYPRFALLRGRGLRLAVLIRKSDKTTENLQIK